MWKSHALKDDVLTAFYLEDSITDRSTSSKDRLLQCHTEHDRGTVLYPKIGELSRIYEFLGGRDWSTGLCST